MIDLHYCRLLGKLLNFTAYKGGRSHLEKGILWLSAYLATPGGPYHPLLMYCNAVMTTKSVTGHYHITLVLVLEHIGRMRLGLDYM